MTKFIITSEMRVGSRWLHYLFKDLLKMGVSPEIDRGKVYETRSLVRKYFKENRIAKYHHATQYDIFRNLTTYDYKVLAVVRNPRDRLTSLTFHQRYKPPGKGLHFIKNAIDDKTAVKLTLLHQDFREDNDRQLLLMTPRCSTFAFRKGYDNPFNWNYIWTTYEWLLENTYREIKAIVDFLGLEIDEKIIKSVVNRNSFQKKSGRKAGQEIRNDEWRRKGTNDDYLNWFDLDMIDDTQMEWEAYLMLKIGEENLD